MASQVQIPEQLSTEQLSNVPDVDLINIQTDPRSKWIRDRIISFIGMDDKELYYQMFDDEEIRRKFSAFITAPIQPEDLELDKKTFYVTKIIVDKLIHEDKEFTEWSKILLLVLVLVRNF